MAQTLEKNNIYHFIIKDNKDGDEIYDAVYLGQTNQEGKKLHLAFVDKFDKVKKRDFSTYKFENFEIKENSIIPSNPRKETLSKLEYKHCEEIFKKKKNSFI